MSRIASSLRAAPSLLAILLLLAGATLAHAADTFSQGLLSIPTLTVGTATYSNVLVTVGAIISGPTGSGPLGSADRYDPATGQLTVPAVEAGGTTYYNVTAAVGSLVSVGAVAGADTYDGTELHIASVTDGGQSYSQVVVTVGTIVSVGGGMPATAQDLYDTASKQLTIPAVTAGGRVYTNVTVTVAKLVSVGSGTSVPVLSQVIPDTAIAGGPDLQLSVYGAGFVPSSVVEWNGAPLATTYQSATQLSATVPAALTGSPRTDSVTVSNAATGGPASAAQIFLVNTAPLPSLASLSPSLVTAASGAFTLTVNGQNFTPGSVVAWNGSPRPTTYLSPVQLSAAIGAGDVATAGVASVTVSDPASGNTATPSLTFTIQTIAAPVLTQLSPATVPAGAGGFTLTVIGTGFVAGSVVHLNGTALPTTAVSATVLSAPVGATQVAAVGSQSITVVNPANQGGTSSSLALQVVAPSLDAVSFQIDTGHSGYISFKSATLPTKSLWSVNIGSQPSYALIVGGIVYVATGNATVIALDAHTGATVWGPIAFTGTVGISYDAGQIFVTSGTYVSQGTLSALSAATGAPLWSAAIPGGFASSAPPVAAQGLVYTLADGVLTAFGETNGAQVWQQGVSGTDGAVAVTLDGVYAAPVCFAYDLQPALGTVLWSHNTGCEGGGGNTPVVGGGRMYAPLNPGNYSGNIYVAESGTLVGSFTSSALPAVSPTSAFNLYSGTLQSTALSNNQVNWSFAGDGQLTTAPIVVNNFVFIGSSGGNLYALNAATGVPFGSINLGAAIAGSAGGSNPYQGTSGLSAGDGLLVVPAGNTVNAFVLSTAP